MNMFYPYQGIALEGGGVCGICHAGVAKYLNQIGQLNQINYFIGSSAGSMLAAMLACRVPVDQLENIMLNLDLKSFENYNWLYIGSLYRLHSKLGLNDGQNIQSQFEDILFQITGVHNITFKQITEKYKTHCILTATSYRQQKTLYYSDFDTPDKIVSSAVQASASYPIEFSPMLVQCTSPEGNLEQDYHIDGGILNNYPIEKLYEYMPKKSALGVMLVSKYEDKLFSNMPSGIFEYLEGVLRMIRDQAFKVHYNKMDSQQTIKVDIGNISTLDFNISTDQKLMLFDSGYQAAKLFFNDIF